MAQPIPCDMCEANESNYMLSNRDTGETLGICYRCLPLFGDAIRAQMDAAAAAAAAAEAPQIMEPPEDAKPDGISPNRSRRKRQTGTNRNGEGVDILAEVASGTTDD
jgi:hypothetical protein